MWIVDLNPPKSPLKSYRVYTSLDRSENPRDPPKSPFKRGTKIGILAPFLRGFGGSRSTHQLKRTCVYTVA
jgi:hypothetical protein